MKIISFSDIHLEYTKDLQAPKGSDADLMILSGDILNMHQPEPLLKFLDGWTKPVIYVPGNHEYYAKAPMTKVAEGFRAWAQRHLPQLIFLRDEALEFNGVHFFGGTMWTDFGGANRAAMDAAKPRMSDFSLIHTDADRLLVPEDTIPLHEAFLKKFIPWLETPVTGKRVVITHHAPALHPQSIYGDSPLIPAFNSLDMVPLIEKYQPDFWFYGHTHECDRQKIGRTQLVSNQLGYVRGDKYECQHEFDPQGAAVIV